MSGTRTATEGALANHPWAAENASDPHAYKPRMWERMVGSDLPSRYACAKTFTVTPWVFRSLGWLYCALCLAFFVMTMVDPSPCEPPMLFFRPCREEVALGGDVIATGIVETLPCGNECTDCFSDWFDGSYTHGQLDGPPDGRRVLGFGNGGHGHYGGRGGAEAYSVQFILRDADRCDAWDRDSVESLSGKCPRHDAITGRIACVELCRASLHNKRGWTKAECKGSCDGLWVSQDTEDCIVLGGSSEHHSLCNGDPGDMDADRKCSATGAPFPEDVSDWLYWDGIEGMSFILSEGACRDVDDDCGDDCAHEPRKKSARPLLGHGAPLAEAREDIVPSGVDEDEVIWIDLPPGDYAWLRGRRRTKTITAAFVVTMVDASRYVVPLAQSMNGPPLP